MNQMFPQFPHADQPLILSEDELRTRITSMFNEMWREDREDEPPVLENDTILLETGFDSMAFAVLVARLDDELGFDPFTMVEEPVYPQTFSEFVTFYAQCAPKPE
jgi:acyl carrier protein